LVLLPYFDSPSVFGGILDARIGGWFRINPAGGNTPASIDWPDTNVLITRFSPLMASPN